MTILEEAALLVRQYLGDDFESISVERVVVGLFFTGVKLSNGCGGICYTPIKDLPQAVCCPSSAGRIFDPVKISGTLARDILPALTSREPVKTAIAVATLNALSATCWDCGMTGNYAIKMNMDAQEAVIVNVMGNLSPQMFTKTMATTLTAVPQSPEMWLMAR